MNLVLSLLAIETTYYVSITAISIAPIIDFTISLLNEERGNKIPKSLLCSSPAWLMRHDANHSTSRRHATTLDKTDKVEI